MDSSFNADFHADDYGISENSDSDILSLCKEKKLQSISFVPNLSGFEKSAKRFLEVQKSLEEKIKVSVHVNFMEGRPLSKMEDVPHLVGNDGFFSVSWGRLLLWNYNPFLCKKIRAELANEIVLQTDRLINAGIISKNCVRFDSHQHPHMIPIVFDAICDAIRQGGYSVEFIRNSNDKILPYLLCPGLYKTFSPSNILKCIILNFFSATKVAPSLKKMGIPNSALCGVFFSGRMDGPRLKKVLPKIFSFCKRKDRPLEILFHPGSVLQSEISLETGRRGFKEFHLDEGRKIEYKAIMDF